MRIDDIKIESPVVVDGCLAGTLVGRMLSSDEVCVDVGGREEWVEKSRVQPGPGATRGWWVK